MINIFKTINFTKIVSLLVVLSITLCASAQSYTVVSIIDGINSEDSSITVVQPEGMNKKVSKLVPLSVSKTETEAQAEETPAASASETETRQPEQKTTADTKTQADTKTPGQKVAGFRVQIFSDNNQKTAKANAESRKGAVSSKFPEYPVYMTFNSPYWRVKVGDFRYKTDAENLAHEIRNAFPGYDKDVRVVREYITVK